MKTLLKLAAIFSIWCCVGAAFGATWFVRQNGGSLYNASTNPTGQCDGKADADYPGTGTNQPCAVNHPQLLWLNGVGGVSSWSTSGFAGGDTLVIRNCALQQGQTGTADGKCLIGSPNPTNSGSYCNGVSTSWGCGPPPPPSGTSGHPTIIESGCAYDNDCTPVLGYPYSGNLTQLWSSYGQLTIFPLTGGVSYINLAGFELTTHNGVCTHSVGAPAYPRSCSTSSPVDPYAFSAIGTDNQTANVNLTDLYIHGFNSTAIGGPIGGAITVTRVIMAFNAFAGWNFDDGVPTPDAVGSTITQSHVIMIGNGCLEQYPIVNTAFPALACWDDLSSGFGDSWSGQNSNLASFTCDQCFIAYNTKDGAMGPHTIIHNLVMTRSVWIGNMGAAGKWGTDANSTTLFQNNLLISNCYALSSKIPGAAQNFNLSTSLGGSYLSDFCRSSFTDMFAYFSDANSSVYFVGNTFIDPTFETMFDLSCRVSSACGSSPYNFIDNIMLGYTTTSGQAPFTGEAPGQYLKGDASVVITPSYNVEYGTRNNSCDSSFPGSHIVCGDPKLTSEPAQGSYPPESVFFPYYTPQSGSYWYPASGSPAIHAGTPVSGLTTDYYGVTRPSPPSIGAAEPSGTPPPSGGTIIIGGTTPGIVIQ